MMGQPIRFRSAISTIERVDQTMPFSKTETASRVMIVDDHPVVREGLAALLAADPCLTVCCQAGDIATAMSLEAEHHPAVAIVDISLQNENGLDLVRRLRAANSDIRILVISMYDDAIYGERALAAGAMGYLSKDVAGRHIVTAVRRILEGKRFISEELTERLLSRQMSGTSRVEPISGTSNLTERELEVFRMIGKGLPTVEIAGQLHLSVKTVETHRLNIKRKLGLQNSSELSREAAHWVLDNG